MSTETEREPLTLPAEPERLPWGRMALLGVVSLVVFAAGVAWAAWILYVPTGSLVPSREARLPLGARTHEVGIVDQRLFEQERTAEALGERKRERLSSYGWVDRNKGLIHVPIELAMQWVVEGKR
ncbi:MAG: hypothetical protein ACOZIN_05615 [Myxococcota bacterium]